MLRLIVYVLIIFFGYKAFRWAMKSLNSGGSQSVVRGRGENVAVDDLVRDPVCGIYVPVKSALSTVSNGQNVYFCSESCRKKFLNQ